MTDPIEDAENHIDAALASGLNPDEAGKAVDQAAQAGVPAPVASALGSGKLTALLEAENRRRIFARDQRLASWAATNPLYAALAHDDAGSLEGIGRTIDDMARHDSSLPHSGAAWAATVKAVPQGVAKGVGGLSRATLGILAATTEATTEATRSAFPGRGGSGDAEAISNWMRDTAQGAGQLDIEARRLAGMDYMDAKRASENVSNRNIVKMQTDLLGLLNHPVTVGSEELASGAVSMLPAVTVSALSGGSMLPLLAASGLQSAGGSYADLRDAGKGVGESSAKAALAGFITAGLMRVIPNAEHTLARTLANSPAPKLAARAAFAAAIGKTAAGEFTEEGLDQFLNALLVQGKSINDAIGEGLQAGMVGLVLGGASGGAEARAAKHKAMADAAATSYEAESKLCNQLDTSKLAERSKEAVRDYMQAANPELAKQTAYFDPEVLHKAMEKPENEKALLDIGVTKAAVEAATKAGSSVQVKRLDLLAGLPPSLREELRPLARKTPDAMHAEEAKAVQEQLKKAPEDLDDEAKVRKEAAENLVAEERRIVKEAVQASGGRLDEKTARDLLTPLFSGARAIFTRNPGSGRVPISLLKRVAIIKGKQSQTPEDIQAMAVRLFTEAGGKTAFGKLDLRAHLPTGVVARIDAVTGQRQVDMTQVGGEEDVRAALAAASTEVVFKDHLEGKTVKVTDENGNAAEIDAKTAIKMVADRTEALRRLKLCLEGK